MIDPSVKDDLLAAVPSLRAFAISLCGRTSRAEDLVQETLMKAWANSRFVPTRFQYDRVALYHSPKRVLFGVSQAASRSG
jgi:hypothetical protein